MTCQNVLEMRFLVNVLVAILSALKHPPIFSYRKFPLFTSGSLIITRLYKLYVMKTDRPKYDQLGHACYEVNY